MSNFPQVPRSTAVGLVTLTVSLVVHLGALVWHEPPSRSIEVAGGGGVDVAMQGTTFVDLTAGETASVVQTETVSPVEMPATPSVTPPVSAGTVAPSESVVATTAITAAVPVPQTAMSLPEDEGTTPSVSARPIARPPQVTERAEAAQAEPVPAPQGTAQTSAEQGDVDGETAGQATSTGDSTQQAAGNAAASSYPGLIQQQIASQRQPRIRATGVAQVSFTIAESGALAAISLAASSGDARFDQAAVAMISAAAPFPPPPSGAQRSFTIPIRAR